MTYAPDTHPIGTPAPVLWAGALAVSVGGLVLVGWALDIAALKSVRLGWVAMKPNTAVAFMLAGLAALLHAAPGAAAHRYSSRASRLCGLATGLIGLLSLSEYAFGWNPGFDQWLFPEPAGAVGTSNPGRMAPDAALAFMLFAAGWELAHRPHPTDRTRIATMLLGAAILTAALVEIFSYFTPTLRTYGWGGLTMMALPTATVFAVLGAGLILTSVPGKMSAADLPAEGIDRSFVGAGLKFVLVFVVLTIGIITASTFYYRRYEQHFRTGTENQLSSIADLKVNELAGWRKERLADGGFLFKNPSFSGMVRRFFAQPADADARRQLLDWLGKYPAHDGYDQVRLMDAQGGTRLTVPGDVPPPSSITLQTAAEALRSGQVTFQDMYRHERDNRIYLQVMVPLFDELDANRPLGVVNLRVDAADYLFPFIQKWPVPTQTAETLLVRREGDDVLFLNDLRFRSKAALVERHPLSRGGDLPAARAVLGQTGILEGTDYRGKKVLAVLRGIPDSPWFLVAKLDIAEAYAPLRAQLWQVIVMIGVLLFGAGAGVGLAWRHQRIRFYRGQVESAAALRDSEARYRTMFSTMSEGFCVIEMLFDEQDRPNDYRFLEINPAFESQTGLRDAKGKRIRELAPQLEAYWFEVFGKIAVTGEPARFENEAKELHRWYAVSAYRVDGQDSRKVGVVFNDITTRKRAEEEIRQVNASLEQRVAARTAELASANQGLEAFSYSVSHDLRAPLRSIDGFSRILLEDYAATLDDEGRDHLTRIRAAAQRMGQLIDALLDLSRVDHATLRREHVNLSTMARAVVAELQRREPDRAVELIVTDGLTAEGDPGLLRVVLDNLLGNAWKFTSKRAHARIEFGAVEQDAHTAWFVRDNGAGFDAAHSAKMFSAFQRLHSQEEFAGTGVGLANVQRIVRRHGGRVWAEGTVDQGATLWFALNTPGAGHDGSS